MKKIFSAVVIALLASLAFVSCTKSDNSLAGEIKGSYVGTAVSTDVDGYSKTPVYFEVQKMDDSSVIVTILDASNSEGTVIIYQAQNVKVSYDNAAGQYTLNTGADGLYANIKDGKVVATFWITLDKENVKVTYNGNKR